MRIDLHLRLTFIVCLFTLSEAFAQRSFTDTTAIAGIYFGLEGPHALEKGDIVISKQTSIRFFRKEEVTSPLNLVYSVNGSKPATYINAFQLEKSGTHNIGYKLVDNDQETIEFSLPVVVDNESPIITASIVYKSITLKQFTFKDGSIQNGIKKMKCPVGSEIHVVARDNIFAEQNVILKEGKASLKIVGGVIELRSKGSHQYVIVAQDFVGNTIETPAIELEIVEP